MGLESWLRDRKKSEEILYKIVPSFPNMAEDDQAEFSRQMLENPMFNFIIASMKQTLVEMWENSRAEETEVREDIHRTVKLLESLVKHFEAALSGAINRKAQKEHLKNIV